MKIVLDNEHNYIEVHGVRFALKLFEEMAKDLPLNKPFVIVDRKDGVISLKRYDD